MQEEYLQLLWRHKRLPMHQLFLTNGRQLLILNTGKFNTDSGPDFFNGKIKIDGITWVGNIEFHVKASDWFKHKHQFDEAYRNTVLHVVFEHDADVEIEGQPIPTLELKTYIDFHHWRKYQSLLREEKWIPCANMLSAVSAECKKEQIEGTLLQRLERRAQEIEKEYRFFKGDLLQLYYQRYARVFGLRVNELPFLELASKIPLTLLWRTKSEDASVILLGTAGFFQNPKRFKLEPKQPDWDFLKQHYQLEEMAFHSWKFKGLRPPSFPNHRILQFGACCSQQEFFRLHELTAAEIIALFNNQLQSSVMMRQLLLINAVVPLLWWYGEANNQALQREKAIEILNSQGAEKNTITRQAKNLAFPLKSSFDSQGLLELKNEFCNNKKCLSCKIGMEVLKT